MIGHREMTGVDGLGGESIDSFPWNMIPQSLAARRCSAMDLRQQQWNTKGFDPCFDIRVIEQQPMLGLQLTNANIILPGRAQQEKPCGSCILALSSVPSLEPSVCLDSHSKTSIHRGGAEFGLSSMEEGFPSMGGHFSFNAVGARQFDMCSGLGCIHTVEVFHQS